MLSRRLVREICMVSPELVLTLTIPTEKAWTKLVSGSWKILTPELAGSACADGAIANSQQPIASRARGANRLQIINRKSSIINDGQFWMMLTPALVSRSSLLLVTSEGVGR